MMKNSLNILNFQNYKIQIINIHLKKMKMKIKIMKKKMEYKKFKRKILIILMINKAK